MRKSKFLSLLLALAVMTTILLVPPPATVLAADGPSVNLTFAGDSTYNVGSVSGHITTVGNGKYHSGKRLPENGNYNLNDDVSEYLKSLYDTDNNEIIDDVYTSSYFDYIGKEVSVQINVNLQPGAYTFYYGGVSGTIKSVTADNKPDQKFLIGSFINLHSASGSYDQNKDAFDVAPITTVFTEAYQGTITFSNADDWLPDLCSIKVVNEVNFLTHEDVITANKISRQQNSARYEEFSAFTILDTCPGNLKNIFGSQFEKAGNRALTHTQSVDFVPLNVKRAGKYKLVVLGGSNRNTKFTFKKFGSGGDTTDPVITTSSYKQVATYTKSDESVVNVYCFEPDDIIDLENGIYTIELEPLPESDGYYTNFIAMALVPADITWGEGATDSGYYYDSGTKYGVIRFFQSVKTGKVTNYGFYVIDSDGNVVDGAVAQNEEGAETLTGIYADLYGLNKDSEQQSSYTMKAFVVLDGNENPTFAPESIKDQKVDWTVHVTDTFQ